MASKIGVYFDASNIGGGLDVEALAAGVTAKWGTLAPVVKVFPVLADNVEAIKAATEEATKAFYPIAEKMYAQSNPQGGQPGPDMGGCGGNCAGQGAAPHDDGVVDADYEVMDDDNK